MSAKPVKVYAVFEPEILVVNVGRKGKPFLRRKCIGWARVVKRK